MMAMTGSIGMTRPIMKVTAVRPINVKTTETARLASLRGSAEPRRNGACGRSAVSDVVIRNALSAPLPPPRPSPARGEGEEIEATENFLPLDGGGSGWGGLDACWLQTLT